jgi:hypothetical protein
VILDERQDADEIAFEMRRNGHDVDVRELRGDDPARPMLAPAAPRS